MFWPSREKIPARAVEGCRCSDSYKTLLEEQVGWHTSLVRGNGSFSKKHTDSYGYILRRKIFANCEKNFAFCKKNLKRTKCIWHLYKYFGLKKLQVWSKWLYLRTYLFSTLCILAEVISGNAVLWLLLLFWPWLVWICDHCCNPFFYFCLWVAFWCHVFFICFIIRLGDGLGFFCWRYWTHFSRLVIRTHFSFGAPFFLLFFMCPSKILNWDIPLPYQ